MTKLLVAAAALAAATSAACAQPAKMTDRQLDQVVAGWVNPGGNPCGHSPWDCGNNGWGNGADLTNPGSFHGPNTLSKLGEPIGSGLNVPGATGINANPTTSSGR